MRLYGERLGLVLHLQQLVDVDLVYILRAVVHARVEVGEGRTQTRHGACAAKRIVVHGRFMHVLEPIFKLYGVLVSTEGGGERASETLPARAAWPLE